MRIKVVMERSDEGYTAYVPSLPGCISEGKTIKEALPTSNSGSYSQASTIKFGAIS
jgi:hypothetical protein